MRSSTNTARLAGLLWVLTVATGGFGLSYIRSHVIVPGDAVATAGNIMASGSLFRAAVVGTLVSQVFLFFLGLTLFQLFREDGRLARVLLASVLMSVGIAVVNTLNHFGALMVLSQAAFLNAFTPAQRDAMAAGYLQLANSSGQGLLEVFWVPYYVSFGLLVVRSRLLPRILGILLTVMGVGFAINIFQKFMVPQFHPAVITQSAMALGALGGIPTMLWLLIKGAREPEAVREDPGRQSG